MPAPKRQRSSRWGMITAAGLLLLLLGCAPPGARALLRGERQLRQGKTTQAVASMELAVQLLPKEARAFNYLGLAYHAAGRADDAAKAYRKALELDRNLAVARFNLGCLLLEQNQPRLAADELTSFTGLRVKSGEGWLKLGHAQLRLGQAAAAELSFRNALNLGVPPGPGLNGIGLTLLQRRQYPAAWQHFTGAYRQQPGYAPAILNAAVLADQYLRERDLALQAYRHYLSLPNPPQADKVRQAIARLSPPPPAPRVEPVPSPTQSTNAQLVARKGGAEPESPPAPTPKPRSIEPAGPPQTPPEPVASASEKETNRPSASLDSTAKEPTPVLETDAGASVTNRPGASPATVPEESESTPSDTAEVAPAESVSPPTTKPQPAPEPAPAQPSNRTTNEVLLASRQPPQSPPTSPATTPATPSSSPPDQESPVRAEPVAPPPNVPSNRFGYPYANYGPPKAGNRTEAVRLLTEGINSQRAARVREALEDYRSAVSVDPSLFEAHYNRGVAAFEAGELGEALRAYERALSINETSVPARFNFAVTLEKSGYPEAAVHELELILAANPDEVRAHLALANLYARRFGDRDRAREHYRRVLELDPQHPQAGSIRFWIEANP